MSDDVKLAYETKDIYVIYYKDEINSLSTGVIDEVHK